MPLDSGTRLGPYQISTLLGTGGMGEVYQARDERLNRMVALKLLPAELVADPERRRRFIQEAQLASSLQHPNIITIFDVGSADQGEYLAMELVRGRTLDQVIPQKGFRLQEALRYAIQITDALSAAHGAGIVHRDLKPGNIMVTDQGQIKILDFGLATLTEHAPTTAADETRVLSEAPKTGAGTILGTVAYMSPEQAEGRKVDARSDIFSFGSILYEMLSGKRAFRADSTPGTLAAVINLEPQPLANGRGGRASGRRTAGQPVSEKGSQPPCPARVGHQGRARGSAGGFVQRIASKICGRQRTDQASRPQQGRRRRGPRGCACDWGSRLGTVARHAATAHVIRAGCPHVPAGQRGLT